MISQKKALEILNILRNEVQKIKDEVNDPEKSIPYYLTAQIELMELVLYDGDKGRIFHNLQNQIDFKEAA